MNNKEKKIAPKQPKQHQKRDKIRLVKTEKDWLEQKRTSKDGKGLVRTEKDKLGRKRTSQDINGLVRTERGLVRTEKNQ